MFTKLLAKEAKQKFIYELENNIPETGEFERIECQSELSNGYTVTFSLSSINSEGRMVTVNAKKDGRSVSRYPVSGTYSEVLEWLENSDEKELVQKAAEVIYECGSFCYP